MASQRRAGKRRAAHALSEEGEGGLDDDEDGEGEGEGDNDGQGELSEADMAGSGSGGGPSRRGGDLAHLSCGRTLHDAHFSLYWSGTPVK